MAVCIPSDMWPRYKSDDDDDDDENDDFDEKGVVARWESYFNESFKKTDASAYDDCRKGATATNGAACNGMLLPPTAPEYGKYEPPYFRLLASSESMPTSDGEKSSLSAAERKK